MVSSLMDGQDGSTPLKVTFGGPARTGPTPFPSEMAASAPRSGAGSPRRPSTSTRIQFGREFQLITLTQMHQKHYLRLGSSLVMANTRKLLQQQSSYQAIFRCLPASGRSHVRLWRFTS